MINDGAVYTDESGNVPELSTLLHFVEDLTTRLNKNRGNLDDISTLAKKVIGNQVSSIQQLETALQKHTGGNALKDLLEDDEDDEVLELERHEFEEIKDHGDEGRRRLRRPRGGLGESPSSLPDRQAREIERHRKRTAPTLPMAPTRADILEEESGRQTPLQTPVPQPQQQPNPAVVRYAQVAQENLELKIELQRLHSVERKLTDLLTQFQYKTGEVRDISKKYTHDYKIASRKLVLSYEAQLELEYRNQDHLQRTHTQYRRRLEELKTTMENAGTFIASDVQQKIDVAGSGQNALVNYTVGSSSSSPTPGTAVPFM
ncbi:hypothetical protein D0Z00_004238 [Geotrichum galactomycetum]|uniref:Uncharacterized protein n=1 Tax=Geotrichum galactomycetum TaxID=27317 RepID=A0ACB6UZ93_9ASCO|nr:hypothetical protein D0Z00_004238 [Geotrichum candidum]